MIIDKKLIKGKNKSTDNLFEHEANYNANQYRNNHLTQEESCMKSDFKKLVKLRNQEWNPMLIDQVIQALSQFKKSPLVDELIYHLERTINQIFKMKNEINQLKQKNCEFEEVVWNLTKDKKKLEASLRRKKDQQMQYHQQKYNLKLVIEQLHEKQKELIEFIVSNNLKKISNNKNLAFKASFLESEGNSEADISIFSQGISSQVSMIRPLTKKYQSPTMQASIGTKSSNQS